MNPSETEPTQNVMPSSARETFPLTKDQLLFAESIYACLPMSIEIYDTNGILRSINEHALQMYGVTDKTTVVNIVNLFNSPYVDETLKNRIQRGEDIVLEFEYDFDRIKDNAYFFTICILSVISSWVPIISNFPKCSKDNRIMLS